MHEHRTTRLELHPVTWSGHSVPGVVGEAVTVLVWVSSEAITACRVLTAIDRNGLGSVFAIAKYLELDVARCRAILDRFEARGWAKVCKVVLGIANRPVELWNLTTEGKEAARWLRSGISLL